MPARHTFFATCAPGVEPLLLGEVRALRLARAEQQVGGVRFEGTLADAWRANLWLRTAVRVLLRLARFEARDADALYRGVAAVDWRAHLAPEGRLWVDAQTRESALDHSRFVEQRTKDAIVDQLRAGDARPSVEREDPDLRVHVHLWRDRATLSLDTSGESLHKRGWRLAQGRAPLAETLAAALVLRSGWDRRAPLLDPFCGSGTILVEAGLIAGDVAPGTFRGHFGFERWPGHDGAAYGRVRQEALARRRVPQKLRLVGSDLEPARLEEARANLAAAGLEELATLELADARELAPKPGWNAWVVSNLPYGERVGHDVEELHAAFGRALRERCAGYRVALLTLPALVGALGLAGGECTRLVNGGLECTLLTAALEP